MDNTWQSKHLINQSYPLNFLSILNFRTLLENTDWLEEQLGDVDDDYILFDCPGQIELYTHLPVMRQLVDLLQKWNFRICVVFMVDSQFMIDGAKFLSGSILLFNYVHTSNANFILACHNNCNLHQVSQNSFDNRAYCKRKKNTCYCLFYIY